MFYKTVVVVVVVVTAAAVFFIFVIIWHNSELIRGDNFVCSTLQS